MKPSCLLLCLSLLFSITMLADEKKTYDPYEDIYLKDGTIYHGYVSKQDATGEVTIKYVSVTYTFENAIAFPYGDPAESKASITVGGKSFKDVTILEEGDVITFRHNSEGVYRTQNAQIVKTIRPVYDGIIDIITTKKGEKYSGHIVETVPGKTVKMLRTNGKYVVIKRSNIDAQQRQKKDPNLSIVSQSPFLDKYELKNGTIISGILTSQTFSSGYLILTDTSDNTYPFSVSEIKDIYKEFRPDFTAATPAIAKDELRVNGMVYEGETVTIVKSAGTFPSDKPLPFVVINYGESLVVEMNADLLGRDVDASPYSFVAFKPVQENEEFYKISPIKTISKVTINPDSSPEIEGPTAKYVYSCPPKGIYALLNTKLRKVVFVWVK